MYGKWVSDQCYPRIPDPRPVATRRSDPDGHIYRTQEFLRERDDFWRYIAREFEPIAKRLVDSIPGFGDDPPRGQAALAAVVDPLLQKTWSGDVERHWRELSKVELKRYLEAAVRVQEIVLNREGELERAQSAWLWLDDLRSDQRPATDPL